MLDAFLTFINRLVPDLADRSVLLAVSGGIDSVVMTDLFVKAGFRCTVAHCNFRLRGGESEADEQFVRRLASAYGLPFLVTHFDTLTVAADKRISTQMAARDLRYRWFEQVRAAHGLDYIATAHHAGDHIETALLNLTRGTGMAGLKGIAAVNGALIRPLLFASREAIRAYAGQEKLEWREDRSNADLKYKRNLIRHQVIPGLKKINPGLEATFLRSAERIASAQAVLRDAYDQRQAGNVSTEGTTVRVGIGRLTATPAPVFFLSELLSA